MPRISGPYRSSVSLATVWKSLTSHAPRSSCSSVATSSGTRLYQTTEDRAGGGVKGMNQMAQAAVEGDLSLNNGRYDSFLREAARVTDVAPGAGLAPLRA